MTHEEFPKTKFGCKRACDYLKSNHRFEEIKSWWIHPSSHDIIDFANKIYNEKEFE